MKAFDTKNNRDELDYRIKELDSKISYLLSVLDSQNLETWERKEYTQVYKDAFEKRTLLIEARVAYTKLLGGN